MRKTLYIKEIDTIKPYGGTMNGKEKRKSFVTAMNGIEVPIVGSVCWWNIHSADITKDQFVAILKEVGLPETYAREHNYRSAFIRALRNLEENRIIRKVSEDDAFIVYQFTAEDMERADGEKVAHLKYRYETQVIVDKNKYYETRQFKDSIVNEIKNPDGSSGYVADPAVTQKVVDLYEKERVRYRSGDITRYIQRILGEEADIVTLRDNGSVYFVPAQFQETIEKVQKLVSKIANVAGNSSFEFLPIPDAAGPRDTAARSVILDIKAAIREFAQQVSEMGPDIPRYMLNRFETRVDDIKRRIGLYDEVVPKVEAEKLAGEVDDLAQKIFATRKIEA